MESEHQVIRVSIQIGDVKVELEGPYHIVQDLMGLPVYDFIQGLQNTAEIVSPIVTIDKTDSKPVQLVDVAPLVGKVEGLSEAITRLFNIPWGKTPRSLNDVMTVLETNGLYYKKSTVAATLLRRTKSGELGRLGTSGYFKYVARK